MNSGKLQEMVRDREADKDETTLVKCLADPGIGGHQYTVFFVSGDFLLLFSRSVMSDSLWPPGLQCTRLPCPSPFARVCSNSCPLSQWCHPTISSSVAPFSSCLQSFPALRSFPVSWFFASDGQGTGASASASVLPMNIQGWFPLGVTGLISLLSKGFTRVFTSTRVRKHEFFSGHPSLWSNSHICTWLLEKPKLWLCGLYLCLQSDVSGHYLIYCCFLGLIVWQE